MATSASEKRNNALLRSMGAVIAWASASPIKRSLVVAIIAIALLAPGFASFSPTDRDEARFAQATKQMLETGEYVDIRFQEEARHKKPAGIYWAQAASASFFGGVEASIWAYRIPSLLAGIAAALLAAWAVRPLVGPRAAFLTGAMTAALLILSFEARTAKSDAFLLAAIIAAQGALARLWFGVRDDPREHGWNVFFFWTAIAVGVLIKGPVIFMPVGGTLLWMCLRERSLTGLGRLGASWGVPWLLLLAAPWFVAIAVKTSGAFFDESIGKDLLAKVANGKESHGAPPGAYLLAFWGTFWPWTALALLAIPHVWRWRRAPETAFLLGWIVPTWVAFELVATKLPHYVMPTYPALCALIAAAALDGGVKPKGPLFWIGAVLWAIPALALPIAFGLAPTITEGKLILAPMIAGGVSLLILFAAWRWLLKGVWIGFIRASIAGAALLYFTAYHLSFPEISRIWISPRLVEIAEPHRACRVANGGSGAFGSVGYNEPSLVFLAGTKTAFLGPNDGAAFLAQDPGAVLWVESRHDAAFKAAMTAQGAAAQPLEETTGLQYNGGKDRSFTLYAQSGAAEFAGCPGADGDESR